MTDEGFFIEYKQVAIVLVVFLLGFALAIGILVTPYVHGQPLLLTRENLAVKDYLDQYANRVTAAEQERAALVRLLTPNPGASAPNVFDLAQKARASQARLDEIANAVEQTRIPSGLAPLDDALRAALAADLNLADLTLTFVGRGDETSRAAALAAADDATTKLAAARQALADAER